MARANWCWMFVSQYGCLRYKKLKPVHRAQGMVWRDELGCEYPSRLVREHLTDADKQRFVRDYNVRAREMYDAHADLHPEDVHAFVPLSYDQIIARAHETDDRP